MKQIWALLLFWSVAGVTSAFGDSAAIESSLRAEYVGKIVIVRGFYEGSKLRFSSDGTPLEKLKHGYWSSDGMIEVSDVSLKDNGRLLYLKGKRILNVFDQKTGTFSNLLSKQEAELELALDPTWQDSLTVRRALMKVLTVDAAELKTMVPDYWGCWVDGDRRRLDNGAWTCVAANSSEQAIGKTSRRDQPETGTGTQSAESNNNAIFRVGKDVNPPQPVSTPDPKYTRMAKQASLQGMTVLWAVVDEKGGVAQIRVVRPLGGGLDDKAVEIVKTWRFEPARKGREPVSVMINIEVNFRLY